MKSTIDTIFCPRVIYHMLLYELSFAHNVLTLFSGHGRSLVMINILGYTPSFSEIHVDCDNVLCMDPFKGNKTNKDYPVVCTLIYSRFLLKVLK